ncbi:MAG: dCTP deaminase [Chlamydiae bacterium]|nr:dCTP deaminase [Chlamydiota bacterium]MBI3277611.1 dCTP deaminase [Chlamydiota bacterium]
MSIKSDRWIKKMALAHGMIDPFEEEQIRQGVVSYGLSSYGYDLRISNHFKVFHPPLETVLDPKNVPTEYFKEIMDDVCVIPPNSLVLGRTLERFKIPRNILTLCVGKSTYARCGIMVNVTPFEPEWEGYPTLQITNISGLPVKIYANEGIAQIIFFQSDEECLVSYQDKKGKYQNQAKEITLPRI